MYMYVCVRLISHTVLPDYMSEATSESFFRVITCRELVEAKGDIQTMDEL